MAPFRSQRTAGPMWSVGLALWFAAGIPAISRAHPVPASTLKAAFVLNFIKFTEWRELDAGSSINVCVPPEATIGAAIDQTTKGQFVKGHRIHVRRAEPGGGAVDCQVLFVTDRDPRRFAAILEATSGASMLVVSDVERSASYGAAIELFEEGGRLRFAINIDTLERSRIKVSSHLLGLAKIVRDADRQ